MKPINKVVFLFGSRPCPEVIKEIRKSHPDHLDDIDKALAECPESEKEADVRLAAKLKIPKPKAQPKPKPKAQPNSKAKKGKAKKGKKGGKR